MLEAHGVDLGASYLSETTGKLFVPYVAQSRRQGLIDHLEGQVFSLLLDGLADKGNIDNELVLSVWCEIDGKDERIHTMSYFTVGRPQSLLMVFLA